MRSKKLPEMFALIVGVCVNDRVHVGGCDCEWMYCKHVLTAQHSFMVTVLYCLSAKVYTLYEQESNLRT